MRAEVFSGGQRPANVFGPTALSRQNRVAILDYDVARLEPNHSVRAGERERVRPLGATPSRTKLPKTVRRHVHSATDLHTLRRCRSAIGTATTSIFGDEGPSSRTKPKLDGQCTLGMPSHWHSVTVPTSSRVVS